MIDIKNEKQIQSMIKGGHMLSETLMEVMNYAKAGVSEIELDALADKLIREKGGKPGFKLVPGYHNATCMATNDVVVHGIPTTHRFKDGDVVCVDCGVYLDGFHTDMAETIIVQNSPQEHLLQRSGAESRIKNYEEKKRFLDIGKKALEEAVKQAKPGNRIGHISKTIQDIVEGEGGYHVIRSLIGHGVGKELHEDPEVPGYLVGKIERTLLLKEGMTIAIEVIYAMGTSEVMYKGSDGWSIATADGSLSAVFERTVAITKEGHRVLTS